MCSCWVEKGLPAASSIYSPQLLISSWLLKVPHASEQLGACGVSFMYSLRRDLAPLNECLVSSVIILSLVSLFLYYCNRLEYPIWLSLSPTPPHCCIKGGRCVAVNVPSPPGSLSVDVVVVLPAIVLSASDHGCPCSNCYCCIFPYYFPFDQRSPDLHPCINILNTDHFLFNTLI